MSDPIERTNEAGALLPASRCPVCHYQMDAATCANKADEAARPRPGDISICISCGEILVFDDNFALRPAGVDDLLAVPPEEMKRINQAQRLIRKNRFIKRNRYGHES